MGTTIESITGISVKSEFFSNNPTMDLFPIHEKVKNQPTFPQRNRVALVYGHNGSGKSTIAQGFREYVHSVTPRTVELSLCTGENYIKLSPALKPSKIFVFDENYVSENIRVQTSGLESIVLLGEQVQVEEALQDIEGQLVANQDQMDEIIPNSQRYANSSNMESPSYWRNQIIIKLQRTGGWAETSGIKIKGNKTNTRVTDAEVDRIGQIQPVNSEAEIRREFDLLFSAFSKMDSSSVQVKLPLTQIICNETKIYQTEKLLATPIERPSLTHREESLLGLFDIRILMDAEGLLSQNEKTTCPLCLQPIASEYRKATLESIKQILNKDVERAQEELKCHVIKEVSIESFRQYATLTVDGVVKLEEACIELNRLIQIHNQKIQEKIENPFEVIEYNSGVELVELFCKLNGIIGEIESVCREFNLILSQKRQTQNKLLDLNDMLAYYEIQGDYDRFLQQKDKQGKCRQKHQDLMDEAKRLSDKKSDLEAQRKNVIIAAEKINQSLEYIFYSHQRLTLEIKDDGLYHLTSCGIPVKPEKISCGERNALALCYFFTQISKDMSVESLYSDEVLLVIDDPISSFDLENKVGVLSFLRWKFSQVLTECATSKILMLTHEMSTLLDMCKAADEISSACSKKMCNAEFIPFELRDKQVTRFRYKKHNEYSQLLNIIYDFAVTPSNEMEMTIGNIIRRTLEAFATFIYKKGVGEISLDEDILNLLPDEHSKLYFRNSMYRLVLHDESHFEDSARGIPESMFFSRLSISEKQRTAKDILCFMYKLNELHILAHLPRGKERLDSWWSDISSDK